MIQGLKEINELIGTWGSLVCNNQGEIIEGITPPGMNKSSLENINRHVISAFSAADESMKGVKEAVLHFSHRKIFALDLKKAFLIVICTPSVDISLLRMTANVVRTSWEGDPGVQKVLGSKFVERI